MAFDIFIHIHFVFAFNIRSEFNHYINAFFKNL